MSIPVPKYTLYDRKDIEVLVAYILYKVGSITKDELMRCTVDHDFVMYFDLICCLFDMEDKGLIICEKAGNDETCLPTAKSEYLAIELAYTIPLSIREDTIYYAKKITSHSRLEKTVKTEIVKVEQGGYQLCIRFINEMGGTDLMELKIYAPTKESAMDFPVPTNGSPAPEKRFAHLSVLPAFFPGDYMHPRLFCGFPAATLSHPKYSVP